MFWDIEDDYPTHGRLLSILRFLSLEQAAKLSPAMGFIVPEIDPDLQKQIHLFALKADKGLHGIWDAPLEVMLTEIMDTISTQAPSIPEEIVSFVKYTHELYQEYISSIQIFRYIGDVGIELPIDTSKQQFLKSMARHLVNSNIAMRSMLDLTFSFMQIDQGFRYLKIESWIKCQALLCLSMRSWGVVTQIVTQEDIEKMQKWTDELADKFEGGIYQPDLTTIPPDLVAFYQKRLTTHV